jgi:hypothetical protein
MSNPDPFHRPNRQPNAGGYDPLNSESYDLIEIEGGRMLRTHPAGACLVEDAGCPIHRPSDHPLRDAPMTWSQPLRMLFRRCDHGVLHPDPDSLGFENTVALLRTLNGEPALGFDEWHPCCTQRCCGFSERQRPEGWPGDVFDEGRTYMVGRAMSADDDGGTVGLWQSADPED